MHRFAAAVILSALVFVPVAAQDSVKVAHDVLVEMPTVLAPNSKAATRVVVVETRGLNKVRPLASARVEIRLVGKEPAILFAGKTGENGAAEASFIVPSWPDGDYVIEVLTKSEVGEHKASFPVKLQRDFRILLVSDKPVYQPGQLMHLRALALDPMTLKALGEQEILFEIEDAKGNKVFKKQDKTNAYGVAAVDFQLADEVIMGDYKIVGTIAQAKGEKTVTVKKYVLPKFKLEVRTDKAFYKPLEKIKGTLQADYFFGKPVLGEAVIKASTFDVAFREFHVTRVKTDAKGSAEFEIQLPEYFVGQPLEKGNALVSLEVTLTDSADHPETVTKTANVCSQPLLVGAVPESGKLVPGIENIVYVLASSPDGSPVEADVTLKTSKQEVKGRTNRLGFVGLRMSPAREELAGETLQVIVSAKDKQGNEARRDVALSSEFGKDQILLRPSAAILKVGQTLSLDVFGTFDSTTVYLDVVRRGQTILTTTCELTKGRARYDLPLTPDLFGSLEIHAYAFMGDAQIVRDSRIVFAQPAEELKIEVNADQAQYLPGQEAAISFRVTDAAGKGVQSALGVIVVDESVYVLQEMQPGLEKIYFMLQKELLTPRIDIKWGGSVVDTLDEEPQRKECGLVLLAPVALPQRRTTANTMSDRIGQFVQKGQQIYWALQNYIVGQKGTFWVESGGKRAMDPKVLDTIVTKGLLAKEALIDPWGNKVSISDLGGISEAFTFEYWAKVMSLQNAQAIFTAMTQAAVIRDLGASDVLQQLVSAKVLSEAQLKDYFGEVFTLEKLVQMDPAFAKDNLVRIMENVRRQAIFERLKGLASREPIITEAHRYVPEVMKKLGDIVRPDGKPYDLETLARENAVFSAANIAKIASLGRRAAIYNALVALAQKGGFERVVETNAKGWSYKKDVMSALLEEKLLEKGQTSDITGRAFDLEELAQEDAQFAPERVVVSILRGEAAKIDHAVCQHIHKGRNELPDDALELLRKAKAITREDATDPWGTEYRFTPVKADRPGTLGCGLLSGRYTLMSAGPDRKHDTADDINVGAMPQGAGYQHNAQGCVFYQGDPLIRWFSGSIEVDEGLDAEDRPMRFGEKMGGRANDGIFNLPAAAAVRGEEMGRKKLDAKLEKGPNSTSSAEEEGGGAIRVREYFPETLAWRPMLVTDADGRAEIKLTMADSITTWRLTASANTADGRLGSTTAGMLVFQDFFVDIDLPVALTQNDVVSVPVAVYNYLKEPQTVTLTLARDEWFELRDEAEKRVELSAAQIKVVYYRIRAKGLGASNKLEVQARGSKGAKDAIRRTIEVVPDGKMQEIVFNGQLSGAVRHTITIPMNSIEGASKILFKAYPGVFASVIDGLEGLLRMPGG